MPNAKNGNDKKNIRLQFRFDNETVEQLDECVKIEQTNRSEIVRKGIKEIHSKLKK